MIHIEISKMVRSNERTTVLQKKIHKTENEIQIYLCFL